MQFRTYFEIADTYIKHSNTAIVGVTDGIILSRYTGFVATSAVTVYELAIKNIIIEFCKSQNPILGEFAESTIGNINGRIKIDDLKKNFVGKLGSQYKKNFESELNLWDSIFLRASKKSIRNSYDNIIQWRHDFVHKGNPPGHATYQEATESYFAGKCVVECLALALR